MAITVLLTTIEPLEFAFRFSFIRETERALKKAILRRDWHRAMVLFSGCCRRAFRNTTTFRQSTVDVHNNDSFTAELDLLQITHFFESGAEIRDAIVERRITERVRSHFQHLSMRFRITCDVTYVLFISYLKRSLNC